MTKDEALKLALSTLDEVRQETFRLSRDGQKLYAEEKVWSTIISIKEALAQPEQEPMAWISTGPARMIHWTSDKPAYGDDWVPLYTTPPPCPTCEALARTVMIKDKNTSGQE